jgi:hypothetical protein
VRRGEEEGVLTCGSTASVTDRRSSVRGHASWASGGSLGSAQVESGKKKSVYARDRPQRWRADAGARASRRLGPEQQAEGGETGRARERAAGARVRKRAGPKAEKRNKNPFLFPFHIFQTIFK